MTASTIDLRKLIGTGLVLSKLAGQVIRDVVKQSDVSGDRDGNLSIKNKTGIENVAHDQAEEFDPQTIADTRAQLAIWAGFRSVFGKSLHLVGEEGDNDNIQIDLETQPEPLRSVLASFPPSPEAIEEVLSDNFQIPDAWRSLDSEQLTVWIDPLDGTREFVLGNYHNVTTLIGISYQGKSIAGIIAEPFADRAMYGAVGCGAFDGLERVQARAAADRPVAVVSSGRFTGPTLSLFEFLEMNRKINSEPVRAGGAGCKYLRILRGEADVWFFPRPGCCRWDSCAGDALIQAMGGRATNAFGQAYDYTYTRPSEGVELTCHEVAEIYANPEGHLVTCDVQSYDAILPYSKWVHHLAHVGVEGFQSVSPGDEVTFLPDLFGIEGKHSTVIPIKVFVCKGDQCSMKPIILKSVHTDRLDARSESKWKRDYRSYCAEACVMAHEFRNPSDSKFCPKIHFCRIQDDNQSHKQFHSAYLMDQLSPSQGFDQPMLYTKQETLEVMSWLGSFHQQTKRWSGPELEGLLQRGSFIDPLNSEIRSKLSENYTLGESYRNMVQSLTLGPHMDKVPQEVSAFFKDSLSVLATEKYDLKHEEALKKIEGLPRDGMTIVHGDFKTANIFKNEDDATMQEGQSDSLKLIDFQWTGWNCGIVDALYFLLSSVDLTDTNGIEDILPQLDAYFRAYDGSQSKDHQDLINAWVLVYSAVVLENQLKGRDVAAWIDQSADNLNRCSHNRSFEHLHALFKIVMSIV